MGRFVLAAVVVAISGTVRADDIAGDPRALSKLSAAVFVTVSKTCDDCIVGVALGADPNDKKTWRLDYKSGTSTDQKKKAEAAVTGFDITAALK